MGANQLPIVNLDIVGYRLDCQLTRSLGTWIRMIRHPLELAIY
jgi:hypothetical protein